LDELQGGNVKKGIFKLFCLTAAAIMAAQLSGCATIFDDGESEDGLAYDRGYASVSEPEDDDSATCSGRFCEAHNDDRAAAIQQLAPDEDHLIKRAIETRDVVLGMTRQQVMTSWGQPQEREVAGRDGSGHERWTYGSKFSLNGARVVIFENGRVAGWRR
jgi:hypothetical protein